MLPALGKGFFYVKNQLTVTNLHPYPVEVEDFLREFELAISTYKTAVREKERRIAARSIGQENERRLAEFQSR